MGYSWSSRSLKNMKGIHKDLRKVCDLAIQLTPIDFIIVAGRRSLAQQRIYVKTGKSKTMNSRHLYGLAIDFVDVGATYKKERMTQIAMAFKQAARSLNIPINWGGDWKSFKDTPHIELSKSRYPNK